MGWVEIICYLYDSLLNFAASPIARARLLASARKEPGAWLSAPPVSALGLRMDNKVILIAVGLRLGAPLCQSHRCVHCNEEVDLLGTHGLKCKFSRGRHVHHSTLSDIIKRTLTSVRIPCHLEPPGILRSDGQRPDGATLIPWSQGRALVWDVTCPDTLAPSYTAFAAFVVTVNVQL